MIRYTITVEAPRRRPLYPLLSQVATLWALCLLVLTGHRGGLG